MNMRHSDRVEAGIRPWTNGFPYVNDVLFSESTDVPVGTGNEKKTMGTSAPPNVPRFSKIIFPTSVEKKGFGVLYKPSKRLKEACR